MIKENKTLGISESCTGGYLSYLFNFLPNSSKFFKGGVVVYTNEIKERVLGVDREKILNFGAVSREVSVEMAKRAKDLLKTNFSIGVTGNLGPTLQEGKSKGLIYTTFLFEERSLSKTFLIFGNREEIRKKVVYNIIYNFYIILKRGLI
ncbi:MAG: CinA family protein [Caldisericia bacterium]|nr:CinA family protein [Caldisericia bacterium]